MPKSLVDALHILTEQVRSDGLDHSSLDLELIEQVQA